MSALLVATLPVATLVFAIASMLNVGLRYPVAQIVRPLRDGRAVLRTLLANFVLVPLLAGALVRLLALPPDAAMGLVLLATAAGAPFLIPLTRVAGADLGMAAGLLVMLTVATLAVMPLLVPMLAPDMRVDPVAIARPLLVTMLLPLVAGLILAARLPGLAERLRPFMGTLSTLSLIALLGSMAALHLGAILPLLNARTALAALAFPLGAFGIGHLLERRGILGGDVLALGTAQRNVAAALVVATQDFADRTITLMIVFVSILTLELLLAFAWLMRRRRPVTAGSDGP